MGRVVVISLLTPSRGRPFQFMEMVESAQSLADGDIEVIVRLDLDDERYPKLDGVQQLMGPREPLSGLWNDCAKFARGDILMQCADDIRFRTPGWDSLVADAFEQYDDRIAYVYGRDGIADERMATHGFMDRRWYEAVGYFTWPHFTSDYGDLWNHTIAEHLGRLHFIDELYTEHLHPAVGKGEMDQTHQDRISRDKDDLNYQRWEQAQGDLENVVSVLAELLER